MFLHGYLSNKETFVYQTEFFKKDFRVFAFDLQGFGENKGMEYPYSLNDYVEEVKRFVNDNGLRSPSVIAHSFGGRIALKIASREKDFFDKMVLTGCAGLTPKKTLKKQAKKFVFNVLKRFCKKEKLLSFYSKDYLSLDDTMRQSFVKIINEKLDYTLPLIQNKTLIIFGKEDKETPVYMARKLHDGIKDSELYLIDGAGHFCFIDKPLTFNMEVREFLLSR